MYNTNTHQELKFHIPIFLNFIILILPISLPIFNPICIQTRPVELPEPPDTILYTMEEVWKDINPSSPILRGVNLEDFLAQPFPKEPSTRFSPSRTPLPAPSPPQPPVNLNSDADHSFPFFGLINPDRSNNRAHISNRAPLTTLRVPFDHGLPFSSALSMLASNDGLRRYPGNDRRNIGVGDQRHKRMVKNRESAARSRARKQAYTNELLIELERVKEENARLKHQLQQLNQAAATTADPFPKRCSLRRTSSAPI